MVSRGSMVGRCRCMVRSRSRSMIRSRSRCMVRCRSRSIDRSCMVCRSRRSIGITTICSCHKGKNGKSLSKENINLRIFYQYSLVLPSLLLVQ